jgi:hypothetical protein
MTIDLSLTQLGTCNSSLRNFVTSRSIVLLAGPVFFTVEEVIERYRRQVSGGPSATGVR